MNNPLYLVVDDRNNWDKRDNNEIIIIRLRNYDCEVVIEVIIKIRSKVEIKIKSEDKVKIKWVRSKDMVKNRSETGNGARMKLRRS